MVPSQRQWELQDPGLHEMATEWQVWQAEAAEMQQRRVKLPKTAAGCTSTLRTACASHGELQNLRRVIPRSVALTRAGTLTGGDLANGVFGSILGHPLPFGCAVVTSAGGNAGELPCGESTTMPSCHGRLRALEIPQEGFLVGDGLVFFKGSP